MDSSSAWLRSVAERKGREQDLATGRRCYQLGAPCPGDPWQRLGWEDARTRALRRERQERHRLGSDRLVAAQTG